MAELRSESGKPRDHQMDNVRFILIFLVVFGHMLETFSGDAATLVYRAIYSFHMPAFLFVSGYFARFKPKALLRRIALPYVVFQTVYLLFDHALFHQGEVFSLQYTTPYWLLWYLLVLFFYNLALPLFQTERGRVAAVVLLLCAALGLAVGFDPTVGYYLSLSRALVFLLFFMAGHYSAGFSLKARLAERRVAVAVGAGAAVLLCECLFLYFDVPASVFYGSLGYEVLGSGVAMRLLFYVCAGSWILLLLAAVPDRKIPLITCIGQRTMPIFLLHGFFQRVILSCGLLQGTQLLNLLCAFAIAALLVIALSCKPVNEVFVKLFS